MGTLIQMRLWMRGNETTPYGQSMVAKAQAPRKMRPNEYDDPENWEMVYSPNGKFALSVDGRDAMLHFGKHAGTLVSTLAETRDGRSYLTWMTRGGFSNKMLLDVVQRHLTGFGAGP